jgi:hypothetical protein
MELNFVIINEHLKSNDIELFFGEEESSIANLQKMTANTTIWDVLVIAGIFPSKSQARKDARFSDGNIAEGVTDFVIGKKKTRIFIFKPFASI